MKNYEQALERLAMHTRTRAEYADEARRRATDASVFTIDSYLIAALSQAREDERCFREDIGTTPPLHLAYALSTEIKNWERLHEALGEFQAANPLPHDVPAYVANVRHFLTYQLRLLDVQHELFHSCLTEQYITEIDAIK